MSGFMNIVGFIGSDPRVWVVLALFALRALWSVFAYVRCPIMAGSSDARPEDRAPSDWRFPVVMVAGIALAVFGLFKLAHSMAAPGLALFSLVLGVYLFTTEPVRRQIADNEAKALRERGRPGEAVTIADLRDSHIKMILVQVAILAILLFGMVAI